MYVFWSYQHLNLQRLLSLIEVSGSIRPLQSEEKTKKEKAYDTALATRNFEIELFWKRSIFFWGFIASSFVGYAALMKNTAGLAVVVASFGFVCSCAWSFVNRGSKRWQENWELLVAELEDDVTGKMFKERKFKESSNSWLSAKKFSVSKIAIALSDYTVLIWFTLMMWHVVELFCVPEYSKAIATIALTSFSVVFVVVMAIKGRSSD